jgi:hypothetical protein
MEPKKMIEMEETRSGVMDYLLNPTKKSSPPVSQSATPKSRAYPHAACDDRLVFIATGRLDASREVVRISWRIEGLDEDEAYLLVSFIFVDCHIDEPLRS